uniref:Down syndrome cell adhesion molecule-like protein Dscam2 n=2 Tax=Cacopsylla melanoneura TaxID=428564 RepID=A0A8D9EQZ0_9HEMI
MVCTGHRLHIIATTVVLLSSLHDVVASNSHLRGPLFSQEPPPLLEYSSASGTTLTCVAQGIPTPDIKWVDLHGKVVTYIPRLRELLTNGSLYIPPFPPEQFTSAIHSAVYRCEASNAMGSIVSRNVKLKPDMSSDYEISTGNSFVLRGNIAVLPCNVPTYSHNLLLIAWLREGVSEARSLIHSGGRYAITTAGALHIRDTSMEDSYIRYYCQTTHKLTGERKISPPSQVMVSEAEGNISPRIEQTTPTSKVKVGSSADLVCVSQASPPATYRWYKNRDGVLTEIRQGGILVRPMESILHFVRPQQTDAGRYVCVASNILGEDRRELELLVETPLRAFMQPLQQVVDVGSAAWFNCTIEGGRETPTVTWLKDSQVISGSSSTNNIFQHNIAALQIPSVTRSDRGMYQCLVTEQEDSAQATGQLMLGAVSPDLQQSFVEQTLNPGLPISLQCVVSGNPPPKISWFLDNTPLSPRSSSGYVIGSHVDPSSEMVISHLNVSSVGVHHGGVYTCIARNILGSVHHSASLNVYGPPTPRSAQNLTVVSGEDLYLRCPVSGHPISSTSWQRGSVLLPLSEKQQVFSNGTLYIKEVDGDSDKGQYSCVARNIQGQSASGYVFLNIMKPPVITPFSFLDNLQQGNRAHVSCSITSGDLPITIVWHKDGKPLPNDPDVQEQQMLFLSTLMFKKLSARHTGLYTCVVSNEASSSNYTAKLVVKVPPTWTVVPKDTVVLYQQSAVIDCQASGNPQPRIYWTRAREEAPTEFIPLDSDSRLLISANGSVVIRSADPLHEGFYSCNAENAIGKVLTKVVTLKVNVPAHFRMRSLNESGLAGQSITLACEADGDSPIRITWNYGDYLTGSQQQTIQSRRTQTGISSHLRLERLSRSHAKAYHCRATNDFGSDDMMIYLSVKEPPDPPEDLTVAELGSRWMRIDWVPSTGQVLHHLVQFRGSQDHWVNITVPGTSNTARLTGLKPSTEYSVRVIAVNDVGPGSSSKILDASTMKEAPSEPPTNVLIDNVSYQSIAVHWKPPPVSSWNGDLVGYQIIYRDISNTDTITQTRVKTIQSKHKTDYVLNKLKYYTKYEITVRVFNQIGAGPASSPQFVNTLEGVPEDPPRGIRCNALSSQSLRIRWEPPLASRRNGIIQGYKTFYKSMRLNSKSDFQKTTNLETNLHSLHKYTNYSIRVLAFTLTGDGVQSPPVYCMTDEDLPGPPESIKASVMSPDSLLISWQPPLEPNGLVLKYNIYVQHGKKPAMKEVVFGDSSMLYECRHLKDGVVYKIWVKAVTHVGEGDSSAVVLQTPTARAPAQIASFSRKIESSAQSVITLPCAIVGLPAPGRVWRMPSGNVIRDDESMYRILSDGSLYIGPLTKDMVGNYTCHAENIFGKDDIYYPVSFLSPPGVPNILLQSTTIHSISILWKPSYDGGAMITHYIVSYRDRTGDWQHLTVDSEYREFTLTQLKCGTHYKIYIKLVNSIGESKPSKTIAASTKGEVSGAALLEELVAINSTSVTLFLDAIPVGLCALSDVKVSYKPQDQSDWIDIPLTNTDEALETPLVIDNLLPATRYELMITARNDAGSTSKNYVFATLSVNGDIVPLELIPEHASSILTKLNVMIPAVTGIITIFIIALVGLVCFASKKRNNKRNELSDNSKCLIELQNKKNSETQQHHTYSPSPLRKGDSSLSAHKGPDYEICPYATFSLPTANHTMQFQTFSQLDCYEGRPVVPHSNKSIGRSSRLKQHAMSQPQTSSPPDGLSLEISCISSQQTLPVGRKSHVVMQGGETCMFMSDSDSSGPRRYKQRPPLAEPTASSSMLEHLDSSTESAEASPEPNRKPMSMSRRAR